MKFLEEVWPRRAAEKVGLHPACDGTGEPVDPAPDAARYDGKPHLAVIESYALDVIGELSPEEVEETENAVVGLYGETGDWRQSVRRNCGWNPLMDAVIADRWHDFRRRVRDAGQEPEPAEFARRFADAVVRLSRS